MTLTAPVTDQVESPTSKLLNTVQNTAKRLDSSRSRIYEMIAAGELEAVKLWNRTLVTEASLLACVRRLPRALIGKKEAA